MPLQMRQSPSGPRILPLTPGVLLGYTGSANASVVLLPAGHPPGVYTVGLSVFVRSPSSAGSFAGSTLSWGVPGGGLTTNAFAPGVPTSTGPKLNAYRSLPSSGLLPILYNVVSAGITGGSPLIDIVGYAEFAALNP